MARSFNGTTDKIDLTNNGNISSITGTNARSIVGWINPSALQAATIFGYGANSQDNSCSLAPLATGAFQLGFNNDNVHTTTTPIGTNSWQHLGCTFTGGTSSTTSIFLYYNGSSQATAQGGAVNSPNTTNSSFSIGYLANSSASFTAGNQADVACWNVVLTAAEMLALAKGARPYTIRPTALVGWWPLDGIQSPEPDLSGIKNNGTLTGTALVAGPPIMMFTPRSPFILPNVAAASFQPAWAMRNRIVIEGIGI